MASIRCAFEKPVESVRQAPLFCLSFEPRLLITVPQAITIACVPPALGVSTSSPNLVETTVGLVRRAFYAFADR